MDTYTKKRIDEIVNENYVHASVLYHFGIKFYDYHEKTLEQVCRERGLNVNQVISSLESVNTKDEKHDLALFSYPVDIIIEYLKHTHYLFIKERLPYLAKLIEHLPEIPSKNVASDLKFVFPLFVEDLILHIYEEEDTLFNYVLSLNQALISFYKPTQLYIDMEQYSIQNLAIGHDIDDDEMQGIREITNDYCLDTIDNNLHLRVVYAELQRFEKELCTHARIENEILFPKALMLEKEVKRMLKGKTRFNQMGRLLAIDYGLKRTGLAVTDPLKIIATSLETVPTSDIFSYLQQYIQKENVEAFVVGMPKGMRNEDTDVTKAVERFATMLGKKFPEKPVYLHDERFTSKMAMDALIAGGTTKKYRRKKENIDKVSAVIILQSFLEMK